MTITDTLAGLLRRCLADFDEDAPRMVLTDHWDELGENNRAEFVRVQCELAKFPTGVEDPRPSRTIRMGSLLGREAYHLARSRFDWLPPALSELEYGNLAAYVVEYRRGFPAGLLGKRPSCPSGLPARWTVTYDGDDRRVWAINRAVYARLLPDPKCINSGDGEFNFRDYATEADAVRGLGLALMRLTVSHLLGGQS